MLWGTTGSPGCAKSSTSIPQCRDGKDNDGDGLTDFPQDPDCKDENDDSEARKGNGTCGDGVVDPGEACDDGNDDPADGCTNECTLPACDDGLMNGLETDVDCGGGTCPPCADGMGCTAGSDCAGGSCVEGTCTCEDVIVRQGSFETDEIGGIVAGAEGAWLTGNAGGAFEGMAPLGIGDVFVERVDGAGASVWIQIYGTADEDIPQAITRGDGNLFVVGNTYGDLAGTGNLGNRDAFLLALDEGDGSVLWKTQFGTNTDDIARGVARAPDGGLLVAGWTKAGLEGQTYAGGRDAFVARIEPDGTLGWVRQLGTALDDEGAAVVVDPDGKVVLAGFAQQALPGQTFFGVTDMFVARFQPDGQPAGLVQLGGASGETPRDLLRAGDGTYWLVGSTASPMFEGQPSLGGSDAVVLHLSSSLTPMVAYRLGTAEDEAAESVALADGGDLLVGGQTNGDLSGEGNQGFADGFVLRMAPDGTVLWSRMLGTDDFDWVKAVTFDGNGAVFVAGQSGGAIDGTPPSGFGTDVFYARLCAP